MKQFLSIILISAGVLGTAFAQDTTVVQTFSFSDLTKRRDVFKFPDASQKFRKILMKYTLKCDASISNPTGSGCGEWDYLSYIYVYNHDGKLDSNYKSGNLFRIGNTTPESVSYNKTPIFDYLREIQYTMRRTAITSFDSALVGLGTSTNSEVFKTSELTGRVQYIWKASELLAAGLVAGNISGMRFDVSSLGSEVKNLEIKLGHTALDSLADSTFQSGLNKVYRSHTTFSKTGQNDLQFLSNFNWNGTSNIIVEVSFESRSKGMATTLKSDNMGYNAGMSAFGSDYYLTFQGQDFIQLDKSVQTSGNGARTIEMWARAKSFNNGGIFQAGPTGSAAKDFSLRTTGTNEQWKSQTWGGTDFTVNLAGSNGEWHHYAMTYDGSKVSVYFDGKFISSKNASLNTTDFNPWIGRWSGSYFQGDIDEIRFWDTALPDAVIETWASKTVTNSHPNYSDLKGYFNLNEGEGVEVNDNSPNAAPKGELRGFPEWNRFDANELNKNITYTSNRPVVVFEQGVYTSVQDQKVVLDSIKKGEEGIVFYTNPAPNKVIDDNLANHPSMATDTVYAWLNSGFVYFYDALTGLKVDSTTKAADTTVTQILKEWYSPETRLEIGRFITPYGNNLSLGPDGFTWWYDVTDYVQYLRDSVDLAAGNNQELIDLKFIMIKGEPSREVLRVTKIWGQSSSLRYNNLDNDVSLPATKIGLDKRAKSFKVVARLTGHGHNSNDGNYPHCCEWKDNEHTLWVNGVRHHDWHIWQTNDCALNPVYPQGGTWPGAREGWCPGDVVKDEGIEITNKVTSDSVTLDYSITPMPANNQGMGNGNYIVAMHLIQYTEPKYGNDLELVDVIAPSSHSKHERRSVVCENPKAVVRNVGRNTVTSFQINFMQMGGRPIYDKWTGTLEPQQQIEVEMAVKNPDFYSGSSEKLFRALVNIPNGVKDENTSNDLHEAYYNTPVLYDGPIRVSFKANLRPSENAYTIKDIHGNVMLSRSGFTSGQSVDDTISLGDGCYIFELTDAGNDGLDYWANPDAGSGYMRFYLLDADYKIKGVKAFNSNFGHSHKFSFTMNKALGGFPVLNPDTTEDKSGFNPNFDWLSEEEISAKANEKSQFLNVFPNPTSNTLNVELIALSGEFEIQIINSFGQVVQSKSIISDVQHTESTDVSSLDQGIYFVRVLGESFTATRQFIIQ
ncbi:MAG: T9SS type A sorting domain-containing protein [Flavobacteriales bacterium]|nr:T9SS type A sorting domain-containing protein [Flavobacteriales bacterium]